MNENIHKINKHNYLAMISGGKENVIDIGIDVVLDHEIITTPNKPNILIIFFNGGNVNKSQWFEFYGEKSNIVTKLSKHFDLFLYNPNTLINNTTVSNFVKSDHTYMFTMSDINFDTHAKKLYNNVSKLAETFILVSHSRGYMFANVFGKMYSKNICGHINIDGGKPVKEYVEYLETKLKNYGNVTNENLSEYFDQLKTESSINKTRIQNELLNIVQWQQYKQFEKTIVEYEYPVCVINNIYDDADINIMMDDYVKKTLKYKFDYAKELIEHSNKKYINIMWFVGKTHWLYCDEEVEDIILQKCIDFATSQHK